MATPVLDDLKKHAHRAWWGLLLRGVLALVVGILILVRPLESVAAFALVIAIWAIFSGVVDVVNGIEVKPMKHWWVIVLSGVVSVAFGVAALYYYPLLSLAFAVLWVAWWLITTGVLGIYAAVMQKKLGVQWGWTMAFGVLSVIAGGFALVSPPVTLAALMGVLAAFSIVGGIALIVGAFKIRSLVHQ